MDKIQTNIPVNFPLPQDAFRADVFLYSSMGLVSTLTQAPNFTSPQSMTVATSQKILGSTNLCHKEL